MTRLPEISTRAIAQLVDISRRRSGPVILAYLVLLALTLGQQAGFATLPVLLLFATCALFLAAFIRVEWANPQPMIDLRLFQNSLFSINLITGFHRPDSGSVSAFGREIVGLRPYDICGHGLARTFQVARPFGGMTVLANVMTGEY